MLGSARGLHPHNGLHEVAEGPDDANSVHLRAARLGLEREACVQRLQAIEVKLGAYFRTVRPYALWPVGEYFKTRIPGGARRCLVPAVHVKQNGLVLRPPLAARPAA